MISRRFFLRGASAAAVVAATVTPAKVAIDLVMPAVEPIPAWCPPGFLPCDGRPLSRLMYPRLFAVMGNAYGDAGPTTFRLPDLGKNAQLPIEHVIAVAPPSESHFPTGYVLSVFRAAA